MNQTQISPIARRVIEKCGGAQNVQRITGRAKVTIYKWCWSKEAGGTGGLIPTDVQQMLMAAAQRGEVSLTPADFFPIPDGASRADR
jgi:hypothetical protein